MLAGTMTVGVVQAFFQYINQTAEPLTEASYMINSLQAAFASAKRIFELLNEEEEIPDPILPAELEHAKGEIRFENVSFGYTPDNILMKSISFTARPGQKIAVAGSTGAGKVDYFICTMPQGYDTMLDNEASNLSAGQKQLLTIARIFLCLFLRSESAFYEFQP